MNKNSENSQNIQNTSRQKLILTNMTAGCTNKVSPISLQLKNIAISSKTSYRGYNIDAAIYRYGPRIICIFNRRRPVWLWQQCECGSSGGGGGGVFSPLTKCCSFFFRFLRKSSRMAVLTLPSRRRTKQSISSCWFAGDWTVACLNNEHIFSKDSMRYEVSEGRIFSLSLSLFLSFPLSFWMDGPLVYSLVQWRWRTNFTAPGCMRLNAFDTRLWGDQWLLWVWKGHVAPDQKYWPKRICLENKLEKKEEKPDNDNENAAKMTEDCWQIPGAWQVLLWHVLSLFADRLASYLMVWLHELVSRAGMCVLLECA